MESSTHQSVSDEISHLSNMEGLWLSCIGKMKPRLKHLNDTRDLEPSKPKMSAEDKLRARRDLEALQKQEEDLLRQISERE